MVFIARLQSGTIDLYGTIQPEGSSDMAMGFFMAGALGGLLVAAAESSSAPSGAGTYQSECDRECYSIGAFYLRKGVGDQLKKAPNGRKKFNELMIPLMRDHLDVVRGIPEAMFFTGNLISIVRQYNAAAIGH